MYIRAVHKYQGQLPQFRQGRNLGCFACGTLQKCAVRSSCLNLDHLRGRGPPSLLNIRSNHRLSNIYMYALAQHPRLLHVSKYATHQWGCIEYTAAEQQVISIEFNIVVTVSTPSFEKKMCTEYILRIFIERLCGTPAPCFLLVLHILGAYLALTISHQLIADDDAFSDKLISLIYAFSRLIDLPLRILHFSWQYST